MPSSYVRSWRADRSSGPVIFAAVGVAYLLLAQYVIWLNDPVNLGAGFWPAAGVTTAALLLLPTRRWGWVLGAVATAELGGDLLHGYPAAAALWWTAGNCVGPLVGATLIRRFGHATGRLVPGRALLWFVTLGVVVGPLIGASIGSVGTIAVLGSPVWQVWPKYVVGDALGVLVVAPLLLTWREAHGHRHPLESTTLVAALLLLPLLAFRNWDGSWDVVLPYLVTPLLTWAALRYGLRGASLAIFWVANVANVATATGFGPFAHVPTGHTITLLQLFLSIAAVSALILAALVSDLVDRDQVEASLRGQAHHDPLTGLPNRTLLALRLEEALHRSCADACATLVVCDLDDFGLVNDSLGHHAGDEVLVEVGRRLLEVVRPGDLVCRLAGDEFAVLLVQAVDATADALSRRLLTLFPEPLALHTGHHVDVRMSVGIARATSLHDGTALLRDADAALHRAKQLGRGRAQRFDNALRVEVTERLALRQDLREGIGRRELFCLHQPEVDLATGELFGFEALVRWQHPTRGLLLPDRFIPLAEDAGLAGPLFEGVLAHTLEAQQRWATSLGFRPAISVNLSARQLDDPALPGAVAKALTRANSPADTLWLEVTETALAETGSLDTLRELRGLGAHIAIDDFGTGWSSLARLSAFPWDALKIDRSFVAALEPGSQSEHLVRAIIVMAHALGIRAIAEGVETHQQLDLLRAMDCDIAQGHLFGRPLEVEAAIRDVAPDGLWRGRGRRSPHVPTAPALHA